MPYQLGIDPGTTFTAAAVCRTGADGATTTEPVQLGSRPGPVPSVLFVDADDTTLVGDAAERRALTDPERVVREFKRRIGDDTPLVVGGTPHQAHDLAARLVRWVVDRVTEREGAPPERVAVTHPAAWGPHREELLRSALARVGVADVVLLAEPVAAATGYASAERVEPGGAIAVYDLGGGTFDAAVVRRGQDGGFELLGRAEGLDHLGGVDFDEAVFERVRAEVPDADVDRDDPLAVSAFARLRRECTEAKEALSTDTEATVPVLLPGARTRVRLVRSEFEALIRGPLEETVEALARTVANAGLPAGEVSAVLLAGGSSRIPLVTQLVSQELGRPVAVDADPKGVVATGAALAARLESATRTAATARDLPVAPAAAPPRPAPEAEPFAPAPPRPRRRVALFAAAVFLLLSAGLLLTRAVVSSTDGWDTPVGEATPGTGDPARPLVEDGAGDGVSGRADPQGGTRNLSGSSKPGTSTSAGRSSTADPAAPEGDGAPDGETRDAPAEAVTEEGPVPEDEPTPGPLTVTAEPEPTEEPVSTSAPVPPPTGPGSEPPPAPRTVSPDITLEPSAGTLPPAAPEPTPVPDPVV
jgi:molecular chaperone DnaK (HSP70)